MTTQIKIKSMLKLTSVVLAFILLSSSSPLYADIAFRADPKVIEKSRAVLLKEQGVTDPDKWRLVFLFHVKGERRPSLFSRKIGYAGEVKVTMEEDMYRGKGAYKGVFTSPTVVRTFVLDRDDLSPLYARVVNRHQEWEIEVIFSKGVVHFRTNIRGQMTEKTVPHPEHITHYYESEFLPFVLVTFPFDLAESRYFDMFYYDSYSYYKIEAKTQGVEDIEVPAGRFNAYKLKAGPTGYLSPFSKNYIWYQKSPPHYVVKGIKNIWWYLNETWELKKIDKEGK